MDIVSGKAHLACVLPLTKISLPDFCDKCNIPCHDRKEHYADRMKYCMDDFKKDVVECNGWLGCYGKIESLDPRVSGYCN